MLQRLKETRENQVTEKKTAEELEAELVDVDGEGFSVRVQRKLFTAGAVEKEEGREISFDEETEVEEFSAGFVEQNYLELIPGEWDILQQLMEVEVAAPAEVSRPAPCPAKLPETGGESTAPAVGVKDTWSWSTGSEAPRPGKPYEEFEVEESAVYEPTTVGDEGQTVYPAHFSEVLELQEPEEAEERVPYLYSEPAPRPRNAVAVVQEIFHTAELDGEVERSSDYGLTEDFEGDAPEAYWVEIEGMDMDRTEYFINGELAEDSIDRYHLAPGDTITFVESDVFYSEEAEASSCGGDSLQLSDLAETEVETISGYTVPPAVSVPGSGAGYAAA